MFDTILILIVGTSMMWLSSKVAQPSLAGDPGAEGECEEPFAESALLEVWFGSSLESRGDGEEWENNREELTQKK
ncbi:hypothetical protein ACHAPA_011415 [Fusarium lateritium]